MLFQFETDPMMLRISLVLILLYGGNAVAAPVYEIRDDKGNITYTDQPPASNASGDSKKIEQKPLNVLDPTPGKDYQKSFDENMQQRQQQRDTAWQQYQSQLESAEQALKSAQQAQKEGSTVKEGDMMATSVDGRQTGMRPSEEYLERQQALDKAVRDAENTLRAVKKQKPQLHR